MKSPPLLTLLVFALACCGLLIGGCDSGGPPDNAEPDLSPDDAAVLSITPMEDETSVYFEVTVENQSETMLDGIAVEFRLRSRDTVVDSGEALSDPLRAGQQGSARALFFDIESLSDFGCYEYDVRVIAADQGVDASKRYPGTCE